MNLDLSFDSFFENQHEENKSQKHLQKYMNIPLKQHKIFNPTHSSD